MHRCTARIGAAARCTAASPLLATPTHAKRAALSSSLRARSFSTAAAAAVATHASAASATASAGVAAVSPAASVTARSEVRSSPSPPQPTSTCARPARPASSSRTLVTPDELLASIARAEEAEAALTPSPAALAAGVSPVSPILQDRFGRSHNYLRISLTERCNLRCVYCMPPEGVELTPTASLLTPPEIQRLLELFVRSGVTKLRLTGGEPTVRKDLPDIIAAAASLRPQGLDTIGITSNGLVLPRRLPGLEAAGLTHVNISLDTLDPRQFELVTRRPAAGHALVMKAIDDAVAMVGRTKEAAALAEKEGRPLPERGLRSVKINNVVIKGLNDREILDFVELTRTRDLEVRFIEFMPFDSNSWKSAKMLSYAEMVSRIREVHPTFAKLPAEPNETSKTWSVPGWAGRVGFISSMSDHFCGTCNRLRMTADGQLKVCLFGAHEVSLRDAMRQGLPDAELGKIIGAAVQKKKAKHAGMNTLATLKNRPMITIGG